MSQIIKVLTSGGPIPGNIPTSFNTDSGVVIPSANTVNINGGQTTINNVNGIRAIANLTGSNNEVIQLTNRISGSGTTTDGTTPVIISSFNLGAVPGTYLVTAQLAAFDVTDSLSAGYTSYCVVRTNGVTATLINSQVGLISEEGAMVGVDVENAIVGNSLNVTAIGLAGKTIHYVSLSTYIFAS
jgi:hypothetical protein